MQRIECDEGGPGAGEGIDGGEEVREIAAAPVAGGTESVEADGYAGGSTIERAGSGGADDEVGFGEDFKLRLAHPVDADFVITEAEGG